MLLHNSIMCPDGTVLVSKHQHDFQMHVQEDGREYFVDGGLLYQRIGYSDNEYTNLCVYSDDPHEKIREYFEWGKRKDDVGKMLDKTAYVKLKDITDDHLLALIIYTKENYAEEIHKVFVDEIEYRNQ